MITVIFVTGQQPISNNGRQAEYDNMVSSSSSPLAGKTLDKSRYLSTRARTQKKNEWAGNSVNEIVYRMNKWASFGQLYERNKYFSRTTNNCFWSPDAFILSFEMA